MVLVAVGNQYAAYVVHPLYQVGNVGDDQVHSQHSLLGKLDAAVDNDDVVAVFEGHHVLADFPQPSQGNDAELLC